ncbi:MAG TPA: response regulator [Methylibium sp.]|uniref:response regulator n=1 Tax=Methylibium sp. TaxID=2067992 RepID=UPI002DBDB28D|nr:response regulator [Methylibium sp.]HEU4457783.1 response regulator [Methylibium sp.]
MDDTRLHDRILVVDDNEDAAMLLAALLRAHGYEVDWSCDSAQALLQAEQAAPVCVLLDVQMPGLNGLELARTLRQRLGTGIVLIAVSGLPPSDTLAAQTFDAVDYYLQKPIDVDKLTSILPPTHVAM